MAVLKKNLNFVLPDIPILLFFALMSMICISIWVQMFRGSNVVFEYFDQIGIFLSTD